MHTSTSFPLAVALRESLRGYGLSDLRCDMLAAFTVSLVALPLSMALSIAVGLPPQHGLYTAIIAGIAVPLLGGSRWQVSGPTAAFVVILAPIVSEHGLRGIIVCGFMAGMILIAMGYARLGRLIHFVPYPVTTGFTAGIAVVLATLSLNDFLGLGIEALHGSYTDKLLQIVRHLNQLNLYDTVIGVVTLVLLFTSGRIIRALPSAMIAMVVATALAILFADMGHEVASIGSRFSYEAAGGVIISGIPPYPPQLHLPHGQPGDWFSIPTYAELQLLIYPAFAIAMLAALESLLSASVADSMAGTRHHPNTELYAIGVGNMLSAMAAGIPATGAIARTATLINNGGRSPIASSAHAGLIMVYVLILAPYIGYIPMAALAALLIHTAYRMSHYRQFMRTISIAPRSDVIVLLTCFLLTVFIDMVAGVGVGMMCAAILLIKRMTELTRVEVEGGGFTEPSREMPKGVMLYRIEGPLFFGTIEKAFDRSQFTHETIRHFILDIRGVPFIDMTGLVALKSMLRSVVTESRNVYILSNNPEVVHQILVKIDDFERRHQVFFDASLETALARVDHNT